MSSASHEQTFSARNGATRDTMCGALARSGDYCPNPANACPHHRSELPVAIDPPPPAPAPLKHDLHAVAWRILEGLANGEVDPRRATVMASVMRVLASLGPAPTDEEDALAEIELRGRLMHGLPPRDEEQWAMARARFDNDAIREFESWERRLADPTWLTTGDHESALRHEWHRRHNTPEDEDDNNDDDLDADQW